MTDPYIPRLRKIVEWVEEQDALPETDREWQQVGWLDNSAMRAATQLARASGDLATVATMFDCKTKACVCGRLAIENGATIETGASSFLDIRFDGLDPYSYGQRELGITYDEASNLFDAFNTAPDVRRDAETIAARVGERL